MWHEVLERLNCPYEKEGPSGLKKEDRKGSLPMKTGSGVCQFKASAEGRGPRRGGKNPKQTNKEKKGGRRNAGKKRRMIVSLESYFYEKSLLRIESKMESSFSATYIPATP